MEPKFKVSEVKLMRGGGLILRDPGGPDPKERFVLGPNHVLVLEVINRMVGQPKPSRFSVEPWTTTVAASATSGASGSGWKTWKRYGAVDAIPGLCVIQSGHRLFLGNNNTSTADLRYKFALDVTTSFEVGGSKVYTVDPELVVKKKAKGGFISLSPCSQFRRDVKVWLRHHG